MDTSLQRKSRLFQFLDRGQGTIFSGELSLIRRDNILLLQSFGGMYNLMDKTAFFIV